MSARLLKKSGIVLSAVLTVTGVALAEGDMMAIPAVPPPPVIMTPDEPRAVAAVESVTAELTITKIDAETRAITLKGEDGVEETVLAGPAVLRFDEFAVGDVVKVTYTEAMAVALGTDAAVEANAGAEAALVRNPMDEAPGGVIAGTVHITAKVTELDVENRRATLQLPDETTRKVKVGELVDLATVKVGDTVTLAIVEALAVSVEKP